jgi:sarcosine oxidase subunit delta
MSVKIPCPNCGLRAFDEFTFGGELRDFGPGGDPDADFRRAYLRTNLPGPQVERWFHGFGCGRWFTITRDIRTNRIQG